MLTRTSSDPKRPPSRTAMVSRAGDPAEQEAEKMAEQTASSEAPARLQASPQGETPAPAAATDLGSGRPLDPGVRAALEPRFGHDFGQVRVHDDAQAAEAARSVGALAFTHGRDVVFGQGQYAPESTQGMKLLSHELAHVVQQSASPQAGVIQRQPAPDAPLAAPQPATFSSVDLAPDADLTAANPQIAAAAKVLKEQLTANAEGYVSVGGWWSKTSQKDAQKKADAVRSALVSLGLPGSKVQASSFNEDLVGTTGQDGHVSIVFFKKPITLPSLTGIPGLSPSLSPTSPMLFPIQPIPPAPAGGPSIGDSKQVAGFKKVFSVAIDGIGIDQAHGFAKVSVKGPTVGLRKGAFSASGGISFSGAYKVEAKYGNVRFTGSLAADRWEMTLSFPGETPTPDLFSSLAAVFSRAEASFQSIASSAASFQKLEDVSRIKEEVKPHIQPVVDAVTAAGGIAETRLKRLNVGISAFGPGPSPVKGISPAGSSVVFTLTYSF